MAYTEPMGIRLTLIPSAIKGQNSALDGDPWLPFYAWMLATGLVGFGAFLLWRFGFFTLLLAADRTWLSVVIMVLFVMVLILLGRASLRLSRLRQALGTHSRSYPSEQYASDCTNQEIREHFSLLGTKGANRLSEALHARLVEQIHRGHHLGWFAADMMIRVGLIGTVIGFIMMLGTAYQLRQDDIDGLKSLLGTMGEGMQVALYTTLSGITGSLLLSIYCKILDWYADGLVADIIRLAALQQPGEHDEQSVSDAK